MKPVSVEYKSGKYKLLHLCIKCGHIKKNKIADNDNINTIYKIMSKHFPS